MDNVLMGDDDLVWGVGVVNNMVVFFIMMFLDEDVELGLVDWIVCYFGIWLLFR